MSDFDVKVNIRCTSAERERFQRKCARNQETPSQVMRRLMLDYTKGAISYTPNQGAR